MKSIPSHPVPQRMLAQNQHNFLFFELPLRNLQTLSRFWKTDEAYPIMKNQIHMGGGIASLSSLWYKVS